ncbi:MAG TPA: hypothetical protein VIY27_05570 [Myxococcota bacterium]
MSGWTSLVLAVGIVLALALLWTRLQRRRAARARGASPAAFLRHFDALQVPDDVILSLYHHLEGWLAESRGGRAIGPNDDLRIYGIEPEDLDDALALLAGACGRRPGADRARPRIASVEDLVRYVASCPPAPADAGPSARPARNRPRPRRGPAGGR